MESSSDESELILKLQSPFPICRICFNDTMEYIDFEMSLPLNGDGEVTYFDGYKEFTHSSIIFDQNMPSVLCTACAEDLHSAYLFLKRVNNAETTLKRIKEQIYIESPPIKIVESSDKPAQIHEEQFCLTEGTIQAGPNSANIIKSQLTAAVVVENENVSDSETALDNNSIDPDTCLQCQDCGKICSSRESFKKHCLPHQLARSKTKTRKPIKCKQCNKTFKFYVDLEKHLLLHGMAKIQVATAGKMVYKCNTCEKSYYSVVAFIDHMHIHNGTKPYKCSICGVCRHTRSKLKSHKYHTHGKGLELRLAIKDEKIKFMETEPLRFKSKCRYCGKLVVNEVIKRHEKMHENPEKRFQCSVCSKTFYREQNLKFHADTHLEVRKPFKCTICGQEILRQYSLKLHMQRHASEEEKFKCDICGTVLSAKGSLAEHREKHFANSKYKCDDCDKTFIRKSRLVYHMRSHTGENPFQCEQCDKSYKMAARLKSHIRVAHANKTYDCDQCESKFRSYGGFVNHKFVHIGYPFKCPLCDKGTANRERLKKHLMQVHKGYMALERFDELYPKKTETRKVRVVTPRADNEENDLIVGSI